MMTDRVHTSRRKNCGFTLIEMVMVIIITGIIASMVAIFIRSPVEGYLSSVRRAELTDAADVALRRFARDVRLALPNSLRTVTGGFEFIMTKSGGRYRDNGDGSSGAGLKYLFSDSSSFDVIGPIPSMQTGDFIVVYNLGAGYDPTDAYTLHNVARVGSGTLTANPIPLSANPFPTQSPPLPSPNARFQVVAASDSVVRYTCTGDGVLTRYSGCSLHTPSDCSSSPARLLVGSTDGKPSATCTVSYSPTTALGRNGLLSITLTLTDLSSSESVTLFREIHVDNSP